VDESLACEQCGSRARGHEMLLCDNCDAPYHMSCLEPPLTGKS
jgi:histone demethylase JARID1